MEKQNSVMKNTAILFISMVVTKIIGAVLKIPLTNILGGIGMGNFSTAYSFFSPVLALTAAALPTVVTRMVAQNITLCRFGNVRKIRRTAMYIGITAGLLGTAVMLILAQPFSVYIAGSPQSCLAIIAIAPSAFFCCIAAVYRGYYEGLMNMTPTAVSQVVEAVFKAVLGLGAAYFIMEYGGCIMDNESLVPFAAAGAVLGVTLSEFAGMAYLFVKSRRISDGITENDICSSNVTSDSHDLAKQIILQCIPVAAGALCANLSSFIDMLTIPNCIGSSVINNTRFFIENYGGALSKGTALSDFGSFVYGSYTGIVMSLFMLVPSMTSLVGKSTLPDIAAAWEVKDNARLMQGISLLFRGTFSIGLPICAAFAFMSEPVVNLLYASRPSEAGVSILPLEVLGAAGIFFGAAGALFSVFQAVNRSDIPVKLMLLGGAVKLGGNLLLIPIPQLNIAGAAISGAMSNIVITVAGIVALKRLIKGKIGLLEITLPPLISSVLCGIGARIGYDVLFCNLNEIIRLMCSALLGGMIYFALIAITRKNKLKKVVSRRKSAIQACISQNFEVIYRKKK